MALQRQGNRSMRSLRCSTNSRAIATWRASSSSKITRMQIFAAQHRAHAEITAQKVFDLIRVEMDLVEAEFERQAKSNIQVISYLGDYLRESGGKRVRPALLLLSAY